RARPWPAALPEAAAVNSGPEETRQVTPPEAAGGTAPASADGMAAPGQQAPREREAGGRAARGGQPAGGRGAGRGAGSWAGLTTLTRIRIGGVRLTRVRKSRIFLFLAILGPGVVAANAGNDAAGIATYASAGSQFVYRTLFFMVLVTVALLLVQEM